MKAKDVIVSRKITNEDASGLVAGGKKLVGKKLVPALGFTDAAMRAHEGDWIGAGIGTAAGGLGLVPPVTPVGVVAQAGSLSLDALNQLRDVAKERGGWGNLGKDLYQSIKTQEYDPSFLPENLEQIDEAGLRDLILKYGPEAGAWLKNLVTRKKPDLPPRAPETSRRIEPELVPDPATIPKAEKPKIERRPGETPRQAVDRAAAEKAAAEKAAAEKAAAEKAAAEKAAAEKAAAEKPAAEEPLPKWNKKIHKSEEDYLNTLSKAQAERYKLNKEILAAPGAPVKPGWVRRAGQWVADNPKKTTAAIGTGYLLTPDAITDPMLDVGKWLVTKGAEKIKDIDTSGARPLDYDSANPSLAPKDNSAPADTAPADSSAEPSPPAERPGRAKFGDQSKAPQNKEKDLTERYKLFLNDEKQDPSYTKDQYIGWAKKYSEQYQVPLSMVLHAMFKETGWLGDPEKMRTARSPTGARGVMQIQPEYAEKGAYKIKVKDLTDPEKNIEAGVRGLAYYYNKYKTPEKALAAYNAGEGGASSFLKTGDVNTLRTKETRNYIKGFKDNVMHQLEKFYPKDKQKVAQVATDVLATAVGAGNAQAADEVPTGMGGPLKTSKQDPMPRAPNAAELAKINKQLQNYKDPVKELEKIAQQEKEIADRLEAQKKKADELKQQYEKEKTAIKDEPGTVRIGPVKITAPDWLTGKDEKSTKKSPVPKEVPAVDDFGNVIEPVKITKNSNTATQKSKPAGSTTTVTDTQGRSVTYTKNEKGQWVSPDGQMLPMPGQDIDKKDNKKSRTQQSVSGTIQRSFGPTSPKADSDLTQPAKGVSTATVPPKSEPPKKDTLVIPPELKDRIAKDSGKKSKQDTLVIPSELKNLEKDTARKDFEQAFKAARDEKGPGNTFTWTNPLTGKKGTYTTDYAKEKKNKPAAKPEVKPEVKPTDKAEVKPFEKPIDKDILDKLTNQNKDTWDTARNAIKINPATGNVTDKDAASDKGAALPNVTVTDEPERANVWRDSSGKPITSRYGEPVSTGSSTKDDIEAAKAELQRQAEIEKDKNKLQAISPDLSKPPESSWKDIWNNSIENLTGKKRMSRDELNTIRVPESINNELDDILRLAGRKK